jgi:hypothetical protein
LHVGVLSFQFLIGISNHLCALIERLVTIAAHSKSCHASGTAGQLGHIRQFDVHVRLH